jgi:hypothetical protein
MLGQVMQIQLQTIGTYGPQNPLAGLNQFRNTLADMLSINGIHNVDRYFLPLQPAQAQQPAPGGEQQQQPQGDPAQAMVAAEQIKAQAKLQSDAQRMQLEFMKAQMQDDRERDRMLQDLEIAMAQISAKYGMAIDTAQIKAQQAATQSTMMQPQQQPMQPQQGMPNGGQI